MQSYQVSATQGKTRQITEIAENSTAAVGSVELWRYNELVATFSTRAEAQAHADAICGWWPISRLGYSIRSAA